MQGFKWTGDEISSALWCGRRTQFYYRKVFFFFNQHLAHLSFWIETESAATVGKSLAYWGKKVSFASLHYLLIVSQSRS